MRCTKAVTDRFNGLVRSCFFSFQGCIFVYQQFIWLSLQMVSNQQSAQITKCGLNNGAIKWQRAELKIIKSSKRRDHWVLRSLFFLSCVCVCYGRSLQNVQRLVRICGNACGQRGMRKKGTQSINFAPYSIYRKTSALILPFNFTTFVSFFVFVSGSMSRKWCHFLQLCAEYSALPLNDSHHLKLTNAN